MRPFRYMLHRIFAVLTLVMTAMTLHAQPRAHEDGGIRFIENRGQIRDMRGTARPDILYIAGSGDVRLYFRSNGISYVFTRIERPTSPDSLQPFEPCRRSPELDTTTRVTLYRMDLELIGANPSPEVVAEEVTEERRNYYLAHCPDGITGVRSFQRLIYREIYPHIDLVFYSVDGGMKYDYVVRPGGRVSDIRMRYVGADGVKKAGSGLHVETPLGRVEEGVPYSYEERGMADHEVRSGYRLTNGEIRFDVGRYDAARTLVIDPTLKWSTYFGGSNYDFPRGGGAMNTGSHSIVVDTTGNIFIAGTTQSTDFPVTVGVFQTMRSGLADGVIVKLRADGTDRIWATYIGGSSGDLCNGIALDSSGGIATCGTTLSTADFPTTTTAFQPAWGGGLYTTYSDGFLFKLNADGTRAWGTYYGGTLPDRATAIAVDTSNNIVMTGIAESSTLATTGAFSTTFPGLRDIYIAKFSPAGNRLWCSYLGSQNYASPHITVAADRAGNIYLGTSVFLPYTMPVATFRGTAPGGDGLLVKFDGNGSWIWGTYVGGGSVSAMMLDRNGNPHVMGHTTSGMPVTPNVAQTTPAGMLDIYVMKFTAAGAQVWGTYYGGAADEEVGGIDVDAEGKVAVVGTTHSTSFPVTPDAYQSVHGVDNDDAFIVVLDSLGRRYWATFLGGSNIDFGYDVVFSRASLIAIGITHSTDFPTTLGAYSRTKLGTQDIFITKFCVVKPPVTIDGPLRFCSGDSTLLHGPEGYTNYRWSNGATTRSIGVTRSGRYWLTADRYDCTGSSDTVTIVVDQRPVPDVMMRGALSICDGDTVELETGQPHHRYEWSTGATSRKIIVTRTGVYHLRVLDTTNGCWGESDSIRITVHPNPKPVITASGPLTFCQSDSVTLDGGGGHASYEWSTGERTRRITIRKSGVYGLKVTSSQGCIGRADAVTVRVHPTPIVKVAAMTPTTVCTGDSVIVVATPGFARYRWNNGAVNSTIVLRESGTYRVTVTDTNGCTAVSDPISITILQPPHASIRVLGPTRLCGGDSVVLDAGPDRQRYLWSTGQIGQQIVVRTAGRYSVRIRDAFGCDGGSDTIEITVVPRPRASLSGPRSVCANASAVYAVTEQSGVQYRWTVTGGSGTIVGRSDTSSVTVQWGASGSGLVRVRLIDSRTGCSADTQLRVDVGTALEPTISTSRATTLCRGDSIELDGGGGYTSYRWSTGATTRRIVTREAGVYWVEVVDASGCSGRSANIEVKINPDPRPVIAVPPGQRLCEGDTMELDAGSGYTSYRWTTGETTRRIRVWRAGTYSVEVVDSAGCRGRSTEAEVTILPRPTPVIDGPNSVCVNASGRYSVPSETNVEHRWRVSSGGAITTGATASEITVQWSTVGSDTLEVIAIDTTSGCTGIARYIVRVDTELHPRVNPGGTLALCAGDSIELAAPSGYESYRWTTGATTQRITVRQGGSYAVEVTAGGCRGTSEPVQVEEIPVPVVSITPGPQVWICAGDSVELDAGAGYVSYRWTTGETTHRIRARSAGRYSVRITDALGCEAVATDIEVIEYPRPTIALTQHGDTLMATEGYTGYRWYHNGAQIASAGAPRLIVSEAGTYRVEIVDANGCTASASIDEIERARSLIVITPAETVAMPGEHVTLRLELAESAGLDQAGARRYQAKLRFDRHLLLPTGRTPMGIERGGDRVITIMGERAAGEERGELATVELIVALGDTLATRVEIEEFTWDARVAVETRGGVVRIQPEGNWTGYYGDHRNGVEIIGSNPTNGGTVIEYDIVEQGMISLAIVDVLGRRVATLVEREHNAGRYSAEFDASGLAGGVYFVVLQTPSGRVVQRLTVIE